jgi:hypothetical protein
MGFSLFDGSSSSRSSKPKATKSLNLYEREEVWDEWTDEMGDGMSSYIFPPFHRHVVSFDDSQIFILLIHWNVWKNWNFAFADMSLFPCNMFVSYLDCQKKKEGWSEPYDYEIQHEHIQESYNLHSTLRYQKMYLDLMFLRLELSSPQIVWKAF